MAVELHRQSPSELVGAGACLSTERSVEVGKSHGQQYSCRSGCGDDTAGRGAPVTAVSIESWNHSPPCFWAGLLLAMSWVEGSQLGETGGDVS